MTTPLKITPDALIKATELTPYEEFAPAQRRKAIDKDLAAINADEGVVACARDRIDSSILAIAKALRRQGEALQRICGHDQITFPFIRGIQEKLPWGAGLSGDERTRQIFAVAKKRVALTCKIEGEITDWQSIDREARKDILQQIELLSVGDRSEMGDGEAPAPRDPFTFFLNDVGRLKQSLQKCVRERPLEERTPQQLKDFLEETNWVDDQRRLAQEILLRSGTQRGAE